VLLLVMAYRLLREFRQASTRLDTPPFSNRRHPFSGIAPAGDLLRRIKPLYCWLQTVFADSIYNRVLALLACFLLGITLIIVGRIPGTKGFFVLPRRWVVERTFGWLGRWRRLSKDYEHLPEVSEAMVTLAMIRLMLHRVAHPNRKRLPAS